MRHACGTLNHHWYAACTGAALKANRPLGRTILGERVVLFRDATGAPAALKDRCLHRNALLSEGAVFDGCLGCPYHGWTYDREGRVVNIPSEGPATFVREGKQLERYAAREQDGLVWVYLGDHGDIRCEPPAMPFHRGEGWRAYYMVTRFENSVTNLVENFMDVPHTVFVHAGWFRSRRRVEGEAIVRRTARTVEIEYLHRDEIGFTGRLLNPRGERMAHTDRFVMPNTTRVDYRFGEGRQFVISSTITPVAELESVVYTAIAFRLGALSPLLEPFLRWYTRQVIAQDVRIMANQGRSLRHEPAAFASTEADVVHDYIESLMAHAEHGGPAPAEEERRIRFWI